MVLVLVQVELAALGFMVFRVEFAFGDVLITAVLVPEIERRRRGLGRVEDLEGDLGEVGVFR
ncbi:hypothetical protein QQ73_07640, partial [Candidatus Endoriftia persephone str. Guaymas]|nr:hypothetical protein [Candidatus Endoriftia persephone str. Guaymas]